MSVLLLNVTIALRNNFQQFLFNTALSAIKRKQSRIEPDLQPSSYFPFQGNGGAVDGQV